MVGKSVEKDYFKTLLYLKQNILILILIKHEITPLNVFVPIQDRELGSHQGLIVLCTFTTYCTFIFSLLPPFLS